MSTAKTETADTFCAIGIISLAATMFVGTAIWSFMLLGTVTPGL
jgi:hypothetical protein